MSCVVCDRAVPLISCAKCEGSSCKPCFQKYLLNSPLSASCMHCRSPVTDDFVLDNTALSWRTKHYKPYREDLLLDMEKARLPDTQQYAAAIRVARIVVADTTNELRRLSNLPASKKVVNERRIAKQTRRLAEGVIDRKGLPPQHEYNATAASAVPKKRLVMKACPASGCRGFLADDFSCPMCSINVCKDCHETLEGAHVCNADTVASVKALAAEARPCPTCAASISKIDGCDQMWCTQCQTTFSWRTGLKEQGHTHNPHYYEFMRRNGGLPRAPGDQPQCGMPNLDNILACFPRELRDECNALEIGWRNFNYRKHSQLWNLPWPPTYFTQTPNALQPVCIEPWQAPIDLKAPLKSPLAYLVALTNYHRIAIHVNRRYGPQHQGYVPDNHDLRVKYLLNDLTESEIKVQLQRRDKTQRKENAKRNVYQMVYQASSDIFRNFINHLILPHDTYIQLLELFTYANGCFDRLEHAYSCKIEKCETNPYSF